MRALFLALVSLLVAGFAFAAPPPAREIAAEYLLHVKPLPKRVLVVGTAGALSRQLVGAGITVDTLPGNVDSVLRGDDDSPSFPQLGRGAARSRIRYDAVVLDSTFFEEKLAGVPLTASPTVLRLERSASPPGRGKEVADGIELSAEMPDGSWSVLKLDAPARPLTSSEGGTAWPSEQGLALDPHQDAPEKNGRAFGYLVASPSGGLRLELAHRRAEASVVYLTGAVAERELRARATAGTLVREQGPAPLTVPAGSMLTVCGPGWGYGGTHAIVAGNALVAVRGRAVFRGRGPLPHDPSRRGLAWTLEVSSVERILDRAWWEPHERAHVAHLAAAREALGEGRFAAAALELEDTVRALAVALGPDAAECNWIDATRDLAARARRIDGDPHSTDCFEDTYRPDRYTTERPVPHPADLALWSVYKKAKEDRYFANIVLGPEHRHWTAVAEDRPVMCWWESTVGSPGYPTARHREVAKTYLFYASEVRR